MTATTTSAEFTSTSDFLHNAAPGDLFTEPSPGTRSEMTYRFVQRLTSDDHHQCRDDAAGGIVETITTTHRANPTYEYRTHAYEQPMFASERVITAVISVGGGLTTLDVTPAKRMSRTTLRRIHRGVVAAHLAAQDTASVIER